MTPTQLESLWKEFDYKFMPLFVASLDGKDRTYKLIGDEVWQWFESKLERVEEEVKQGLESNDIEVELDTEQCSEIALMVYEKYLEWLKKPQSMIIPFNEWVERNLKSNKLEQPSWRCGKCEQEEMRSKGIAIICPIPEHSIRCSLRKSNKLEDKYV